MRRLRSLACAGLAMMTLAVCASMPAAAAVPIDVGIMVQRYTAQEHPAPTMANVHEEAAVLPAMPAFEVDGGMQSFTVASSRSFADTSVSLPAYRHIDPDIAD